MRQHDEAAAAVAVAVAPAVAQPVVAAVAGAAEEHFEELLVKDSAHFPGLQ